MADPVLAPDLHRVHADLFGQLVHHPLDGVRRLRSTGAAVGIRRRLGGEHAVARERVRLHLVDRVEHESAEQRHAGGDELQVGTHVGEQLDLQPEQRAVLRRRYLQVLNLIATVDGRLVALATGLGPLHRPSKPTCNEQGDDLLGVDVEL